MREGLADAADLFVEGFLEADDIGGVGCDGVDCELFAFAPAVAYVEDGVDADVECHCGDGGVLGGLELHTSGNGLLFGAAGDDRRQRQYKTPSPGFNVVHIASPL